jgi:protein gp37/ParB-like chromosome segregation protein Spo0J
MMDEMGRFDRWLDRIPIAALHPHPQNPRFAPRQDVVDAIAAGLVDGFPERHALTVRQDAAGYEIISGHHRCAAAIKAGLTEVPCWVVEMDDATAFMELVRSNAQGELSTLERGMHALHSGMDVKAYAASVGRKRTTVQDEVKAARVASSVTHMRHELTPYVRHLAEIHAAPSWLRPAMVTELVANPKKWTIEKIREQVARLKDVEEPLAWMDVAAIAAAIIAGHMRAADVVRMAKAADIVLTKPTVSAEFGKALAEEKPSSLSAVQAIARRFLDQQEDRIRRAHQLRQQRQVKREAKTRDDAARREALMEFVSLDEWSKLSADERKMVLAGDPHAKRGFNKQDNFDIEWAMWSWNPITGCLHDCPYCYARDIAGNKRMASAYPNGFAPTLKARSLLAPRHMAVPREAHADARFRNVFTGSMTDLFGRWVPEEWIEAVLREMHAAPDWNFLCLTKFPKRMAEFDIPENVWMGTTVDLQARVAAAEAGFAKLKCKVKWLSCEPLLEPLKLKQLELFDWMVVGGASASSKSPEWHPPSQWIYDLRRQAEAAGVVWYEKTNLWSSSTSRTLQLPNGLPVAPDTDRLVKPQRELTVRAEPDPVFRYLGSKSGPKAAEAA